MYFIATVLRDEYGFLRVFVAQGTSFSDEGNQYG
jgi:hypothetical protein